MTKAKQYMSGSYVAERGEKAGRVVTTREHPYGRNYTIHDGKGNSLTVPDRPLAKCEQHVANGWFKKFLGIVLLLLMVVLWLILA